MNPVLITTSGIGERLGKLTKSTNKALVQLGDKYAICHIIEQYPINTEFIITLGHYGDYVRQFLELAYPMYKFNFITIDKYEGEGSSLGYSLLKCKNTLMRPFIFHCCDSIITSPITIESCKNILYVYKSHSSSQYTNIKIEDTIVKQINNKNTNDFDYIYTGISYIYNYNEFWNYLEEEYNKLKNNFELSDVNSIRKMISNNIVFNYKVLDVWYDTGNLESYGNALEYFKGTYTILEKDYESLCFFDTKVIKFINDNKINKKRFLRGSQLYPLTPNILAHSKNYIVMEKIQGMLLSELYNYGEIYKLLEWANSNLWNTINVNEKYKDVSYNFYFKKTYERINKLDLNNEYNIINGLQLSPILNMIKKLDINRFITNRFTKFHGDFILDNIIKTGDSYKLLDYRHEFDNQLYYGDIYYDLAKLRHNLFFNHDNISNNLFSIEYKDNEVIVDLKCNYFLIQQLNDYDKFVIENNYDLNKIKKLTAIIWLNMSPLYDGKLSEFLFYFGKYNLFVSI